MQDLPKLIKELQTSVIEAGQERAKADALFLSIGEGVLATDEQGIIRRVNQVALDMLGFKEADLIGSWYPKVIVATDEKGHKQRSIDRPITEAFLTGKPVAGKTFYTKKDSTLLPVYVTLSPLMLDGAPVGAIEVFRDITKELAIDKMKNEFIALASHQLRTPLSTINIYVHLLKDGYGGPLSDEQMEYVLAMLSAGTRMQSLIEALLNISKLESGQLTAKSQAVPLPKIMNEVLAELNQSIVDKKLSVTFKPSKELPEPETDCLMIQEVLTNLVANAIQYTPELGKITITMQRKANEMIIKVKDSGIGIPKEKHTMLFSPFFRAQNALEFFEAGTGLGLYLVKLLVQTLGGKVWFTSQEDKGSTFFVALPLVSPEQTKAGDQNG